MNLWLGVVCTGRFLSFEHSSFLSADCFRSCLTEMSIDVYIVFDLYSSPLVPSGVLAQQRLVIEFEMDAAILLSRSAAASLHYLPQFFTNLANTHPLLNSLIFLRRRKGAQPPTIGIPIPPRVTPPCFFKKKKEKNKKNNNK